MPYCWLHQFWVFVLLAVGKTSMVWLWFSKLVKVSDSTWLDCFESINSSVVVLNSDDSLGILIPVPEISELEVDCWTGNVAP